MFDTKLIEKLSNLCGVSGYEYNVAEYVSELFGEYCDEVYSDPLGNVIAVKKSTQPNAPKLMIEAHMDEIGLMVTDIDEDGFLRFTQVGGIDARILPANEAIVHGKEDVFGIIGAKPPHLMTAEESGKTTPMSELYIDIGYSREQVMKIVQPGDTATFRNKTLVMKNGTVSTKSQDDRTSVAVLASVMKKLAKYDAPYDIYYCACVQEEVGLRGAKTAAYGINPDMAIVIDVCHATTPDSGSDEAFDFGSGAILTKGPNIHPKLLSSVMSAMDDAGISYELEVEGGDTGTDAWAVQVSRCGIPTVLFSIPLRYMHTPVETVSCADLSNIVNAICSFITSEGGADICF